ncbi:MAG: endonuclease [Candidatus Cloacimonetes bacterium]|nr:endonuclease [Candidatus Cloacimonadota bacterium]
MSKNKKNRYTQLIEDIFFQYYSKSKTRVEFLRVDLEKTAKKLKMDLPKNLGDIIYSFKFRSPLPKSICDTSIDDKEWVIKNIGRAQYAFELVKVARIIPDEILMTIKIPDATPNIVDNYALNDEQALLAKVRYNRLLDIFTGVTCYSLQNHLRTTVPDIGQVETDEIYVGVDKFGRQFVLPVQAKGGSDEIAIVQIEQDILLCKHKYPKLICRSIAVQFIDSNKICMFEFIISDNEIKKLYERHYELVSSSDISDEDLLNYNKINS